MITDKKEQHKIENLWSIVMVELTNRCNFSCEFCPSDVMNRKKEVMPRELWEKVLRELGEKKMASTVFFHLMGEPLLHSDVYDAIRFANSYGLAVSLYTNAALLDEVRTEKLLDSLTKGRVVLSMQDISPERFDTRCHSAISWEDYLDRIKNFMIKAKLCDTPVQVHCLADVRGKGWNISGIWKEQKQIQKVYDVWCSALDEKKKHKINVLDPAAIYPLGENASFYVKHKGTWDNKHIGAEVEVKPAETGYCALMTDTFAILADGTCTYCCCDYEGDLDLGNAKDNSLEGIYYGEKAAGIRKAGEEGLMIEDRCKVCRGKLVYKKTQKSVPLRNFLSEYYFFKDHFRRYGGMSAIRKVAENLGRRIGR